MREHIARDNPGVIAPPPVIYAVGLGFGFMVNGAETITLPIGLSGLWLGILGSIVILPGVALMVWAF